MKLVNNTTMAGITIRKDAYYFKAAFIDFYKQRNDIDLIANEVPYGSLRKISDLVIIKNNRTISVEIKSELDSTDRLQSQINESSKVFDYVIVFVGRNQLTKIIDLISQNIGIYYLEDNKIKTYRRPKILKSEPIEIAYSIPVAYIEKQTHRRNRLNVDEYRNLVSQEYHNQIKKLFISYLNYKYKGRYELFNQENNDFTHIDDISLLSYGEIIV